MTTIYKNFINGKWVESSSGETESSLNPSNVKEVVGYVPVSAKSDVDQAVKAAKESERSWKKKSSVARGNILYKAAEIMESRIDEIAETMTKEAGKTLPESKGETNRGIAILRYFAGEGMRKTGDVIPATDNSALMYTDRTPLGTVGLITPWNFPVAIPLWKMAPALIYGNAVVIKPAGDAPITAVKIIECLEQAGIPKGVVNIVMGKGSVVGDSIINHSDINGISFTGSNSVGQRVAKGASSRGAKYQLEMGGKNPVIVADDADLDKAVDATISGGLGSTGQKCTATSRIIVQEDVYESFKQKLLKKVEKITVGDGFDSNVWMGPSVNEQQLNTVLSYINKGKEDGATPILEGSKPTNPDLKNGYFVTPTIFDEVKHDATIAQEEIFGPVLALIKVETIEEALKLANDIDFGLSASIFTENIQNAFTFIEDIDVGLVRVNFETAGVELHAPFGGMKNSSFGSREQGQAAKEFYTNTRTVFVKP